MRTYELAAWPLLPSNGHDHFEPERVTQPIHDAGGRDVASGIPIQPDRQVGSLPGTTQIR
jgi:hypothetical protein